MKLSELMKKLDDFYPLCTALSWDNSGLQIGDNESLVGKIYVCLDLEDFHIDNAVNLGANLIITHHPLFFKGLKSIRKSSFYYDVIGKLILNNINVLSYHTPFDISNFGMKNFFMTKFKTCNEYDFVLDEGKSLGIVFDIKSQSLAGITDLIYKHLIERYDIRDWRKFIRVYGNKNSEIKKIAYLGGSGADFIFDAIDKHVDLYITGDIKYHDAQIAYRNNLNLIDLSHGISEIQFVDIMSDKLEDFGLEVIRNYWTYDRKLVE